LRFGQDNIGAETMIFKKLVLENYKIYYGNQILDFSIPKTQDSPYRKNLILVGGLNGAGKTTILNAINYVLFGRQGMSQKEFEDSFISAINDRAYDEGHRECSLELTLEDENETITITVTWSFDSNKKLINENRSVFVQTPTSTDSRETYNSSEEYLDFINRRIPFDVAPFFIFDGEKIQELVERQDQKLMKDSIQKIVSLEVYKSLVDDLGKLQTTLERKLSTKKSDKELADFINQINESDKKIQDSKEKIKQVNEAIEINEKEKLITDQQRRQKLVQNTESSIEIAKRISEYETKFKRINSDIEDFAKEGLSHLLLASSISGLKDTLQDEKIYLEKKAQQEALLKAKFAPFETFISEMLTIDTNPQLSAEQKQQLHNHGKIVWGKVNKINQQPLEERKILHDISPKDREKILSYSKRNLYDIRKLIDEKTRLEKLINKEKESLENAPDPVDTKEEDAKLLDIQSKLGELYHRRKQHYAIKKKHEELVEQNRNKAKRLREDQKENTEAEKQYQYITKLKDAAIEFVDEMTELKATQIRTEFATILEKLARKDQDFEDVEFDQKDFVIRIYNDKGVEIKLKDRSAGEKQIIALSFIWALTKTAGLSLPFVIDTPLGRLDSIHRNHIIHHYFNALSDQVIILSTDTEVNRDYIDFISNYMIRGYELVYNKATKSTSIQEGYFSFT
jgi:DNA sulfur modification protein DndD